LRLDFVPKTARPALFFAVLLLAAYLRITGLNWGLAGGCGHYRNFHPDEFLSLRGVLELDLLHGQIVLNRDGNCCDDSPDRSALVIIDSNN
jgi:hypothetical protein